MPDSDTEIPTQYPISDLVLTVCTGVRLALGKGTYLYNQDSYFVYDYIPI